MCLLLEICCFQSSGQFVYLSKFAILRLLGIFYMCTLATLSQLALVYLSLFDILSQCTKRLCYCLRLSILDQVAKYVYLSLSL